MDRYALSPGSENESMIVSYSVTYQKNSNKNIGISSKTDSLKFVIQEMEGEILRLRETLDRKTTEQDSWMSRLNKVKLELNGLDEAVNRANIELDHKQMEFVAMEKKHSKKNNELVQEEAELEQLKGKTQEIKGAYFEKVEEIISEFQNEAISYRTLVDLNGKVWEDGKDLNSIESECEMLEAEIQKMDDLEKISNEIDEMKHVAQNGQLLKDLLAQQDQ